MNFPATQRIFRIKNFVAYAVLLAWFGLINGATVRGQTPPAVTPETSQKPEVYKVDTQGTSSGPVPGLVFTQLQGSLVAPPLRMLSHGVVAATNDRKINLVSPAGRVLWTAELQRQILAPLYSVGDAFILVSSTGDNLSCFRIDGTRIWDKRLTGLSESWLLANTEGRLVQVFKNGRLRVMNPDTSLLFELDLGQNPAGPPALDSNGIRIPISGTKARYLLPDGSLSESKDIVINTGIDTVRFNASQRADIYDIRFISPQSDLSFSSAGSFSYWSVDNRKPRTAAWGDSKWKLFQFAEQQKLGQGGTQSKLVSPGPTEISDKDLFDNATQQQMLEVRYVHNLLATATNDSVLIDYLGSATRPARLPGRLLFYEDMCVDLLSSNIVQSRFPVLRIVLWDTLASFPSLNRARELSRLLLGERDKTVLAAAFGYVEKRGSDPGGDFRFAFEGALPFWRADPAFQKIAPTLLSAVKSVAPTWPPGMSYDSFAGEILGR